MQLWRGTGIHRLSSISIRLVLGVMICAEVLVGQTKPDPPALNAATNITTSSADISWSVVTGASSYSYEVSTTSNFQNLVNSGSTANTSVTITGLKSGTTYYYQVAVTVAGKTSNSSKEQFFTTLGSLPAPPDPPVLGTPTVTASSASLQWSAATGAASYTIEVASDNKFNKSVGGGSTTTLSFTIENLTLSTQYYYRVQSVSADNQVSAWVEGSFTTLAPALATPTLASPADGSTSIAINPALQWSTVTGATSYGIQVSTSSDFSGAATQTSTTPSLTLASLQHNTMYYWRVNASNGTSTSGWSSARKFTTVIGLPGVPSLVEPADGASGISTSPTLKWNAVTGAENYDLQVSTKSDFSSVDVADKQRIRSTSESLSRLAENTKFYWRVRATNSAGSGNWSSTASFNTQLALPATPSLVEPANGATGISTSPTLKWNAVTGAETYDLQVSTKSDFSTAEVADKSRLKSTSESLSRLTEGTSYYWRVRSVNAAGTSDWASASFKTQIAPPAKAPTLTSPADKSTIVPPGTTLSWSSVTGATSYSVQIAEDSKFPPDQLFINVAGLKSTTSHAVTGLKGDKTYYWKVSAENEGGSSGFSSANSFFTASTKPAAPALTFPDNGAIGQPVNITFAWSVNSDPSSNYEIQVATDAQFHSIVVSYDSLIRSSWDAKLSYDQTYYWHVRVTNDGGTSDWSTTRRFTTETGKPAQVILISPSDKASQISLNSTLYWQNVLGALSYRVQVSGDKNFNTLKIDTSGLKKTEFMLSGLVNGLEYYWRVYAIGPNGEGVSSAVWSFKTIISTLSTPTLQLPQDKSDIALPVTLTWGFVASAKSYRIQISMDRNYSPVLIDSNGVTITSLLVTRLLPNQTYYWHVQASNNDGASSWSDSWNFKTKSSQLATPALIKPSDKLDNLELNPVLEWAAVLTADTYRIQVTKDSKFDAVSLDTIVKAATSLQLNGLDPSTQYYWRVLANNLTGISAWSDVRSFKTGTSTLAKPKLLFPENGVREVPLEVTFQWEVILKAKFYALQYSLDRDFKTSATIEVQGIEKAQYSVIGLLPETKYFWRIQAKDLTTSSGWTDAQSFTTGSGKIAAPALVQPGENVQGVSTSPTLSWTSVLRAKFYGVLVASDRNFRTVVYEKQNLTTTSHQVSGLTSGTEYFWRVSATDSAGGFAWSTERSFTTGSSLLSTPALITPSDNAEGTSINPTLEWSKVDGSSGYELQVSTQKSFNTLVEYRQGISSTFASLSGLLFKQTYYWRIRAVGTISLSEWSKEYQFTTGASKLSVPTLIAPEDRATDVSTEPSFEWAAVEGARSYLLQISTGQSFSSVLFSKEVASGNSTQISGLNTSTQYYWRIRSLSTTDTSDWSTARRFTTWSDLLSAPALIAPSDGASGQSITPTLAWAVSPRALTYTIQYSTSTNFTENLVEIKGVSKAAHVLSELLPLTKYYWRVNAVDAFHVSTWSQRWSFTTGSNRLAAPDLLTPTEGADLEVGKNPTLTWKAVPGVTQYEVQVSLDKNFSPLLVNEPVVLATSLTVTGLQEKSKYYWKVRSTNGTAWSDWSAVWSFSIKSQVTSVAENKEIPQSLRLLQNYPNPFNPSTSIVFDIPNEMHLRIAVYSLDGKLLSTIINGTLRAGHYSFSWHAENLPSGVYFCRLESAGFTSSVRMLLLK